MTVEHAGGRIQFDRPVGSFQSVLHRLAYMLCDLEDIRCMVARLAATGSDRLASPLAVWTAQASRRILAGAHQIHGGVGFIRVHPLFMFFGRQKAYEVNGGLERQNLERIAEVTLS